MEHNITSCILFTSAVLFLFTVTASGYSDASVASFSTGQALTNAGNYTEAIAAYDRAISINPGYFDAWNGKADALNRAKRYSDALAASDQALAINPNYVSGWINRGYILYNLGRFDEELEAYGHAIAIDEDNADAWFNSGYALAGMKKYDEAVRAFNRVEEIDPEYPNLQANRKIAEAYRDASIPVIVKYAPWIALGIIMTAGISVWVYTLKKKCKL
jgi:tetratricopeptide (TPR) repeat protein